MIEAGPATVEQAARSTPQVLDVSRSSDRELLSHLVGSAAARRLYRGSLQPLFAPPESRAVHPRCAAARELVKRWLAEEMQARTVFASADTVKDFLKVHFGGRDYESFVVLYLDAQNRLIEAEEIFRGTLTQTSVYPREIVKAALQKNAASVVFPCLGNHRSSLILCSKQGGVPRTLRWRRLSTP